MWKSVDRDEMNNFLDGLDRDGLLVLVRFAIEHQMTMYVAMNALVAAKDAFYLKAKPEPKLTVVGRDFRSEVPMQAPTTMPLAECAPRVGKRRRVAAGDGPPCPRCGTVTKTWKHSPDWVPGLRATYYEWWHECANKRCSTKQIMPPEAIRPSVSKSKHAKV